MNHRSYYTVELEVTVWPEIYDGKMSYAFPTKDSAVRFALCNLNEITPKAKIFDPSHNLIGLVNSDSRVLHTI